MKFTQGRTVVYFYITLRRLFQAGNVHESASLFNLKEKKIDMKGSRIRTHDPEDPVSTPH